MTSILLLGDVMLARGVSDFLESTEPADVWGDTLPLLRSADLRLVNLECCISEKGREFKPPRVFYFRAIPKAIDALRSAGINVVTLANNHSLDYGPEALLDTLDRLDSARIFQAGSGASIEAACAPAIVESSGMKVGVVAFTDNFPEYGAGSDSPGTFYLPIDHGSLPKLSALIEQTRQIGADIVVVSAHWGPNMRRHPPQHFQEFARATIDAGADVWFGHSAHIFQGVEFYRQKPIIYDAGDFLDDYRVDPVERNNLSLAWWIEFNDSIELAAHPVKLSFAQTNMAVDHDFDWIVGKLGELCGQMGTRVLQEGQRLLFKPV
jgi:poly-gamma-glutamate capsule biosynthesis protein CapA/YwtB (metallophosphatase superfamily)